MKLAGSNRGKKLSASNYATLSGATPFSREETRDMNRQALAVIDAPEFDESGSAFFAPDATDTTALDDSERSFLDAMIERRGLAQVLKAVQFLLESRIEEGMMQSGTILLHLSRDDAFARAAERLRDLAFHPDIAQV